MSSFYFLNLIYVQDNPNGTKQSCLQQLDGPSASPTDTQTQLVVYKPKTHVFFWMLLPHCVVTELRS